MVLFSNSEKLQLHIEVMMGVEVKVYTRCGGKDVHLCLWDLDFGRGLY